MLAAAEATANGSVGKTEPVLFAQWFRLSLDAQAERMRNGEWSEWTVFGLVIHRGVCRCPACQEVPHSATIQPQNPH